MPPQMMPQTETALWGRVPYPEPVAILKAEATRYYAGAGH